DRQLDNGRFTYRKTEFTWTRLTELFYSTRARTHQSPRSAAFFKAGSPLAFLRQFLICPALVPGNCLAAALAAEFSLLPLCIAFSITAIASPRRIVSWTVSGGCPWCAPGNNPCG